jgi:hypothetical protein
MNWIFLPKSCSIKIFDRGELHAFSMGETEGAIEETSVRQRLL